MTTSDSPAGRPGLSNVVDIVVSPDAAFARLRAVPTWGWAFIAATVLGVIGSLLAAPAILHAMDVSLPAQLAANPRFAALPADAQQRAIATQLRIAHVLAQLAFIGVPITLLVGALLQAVIMLVANAASKADGTFKSLFALSMTVSVVGVGLGSLVLGIIVLVRGTGSFDTMMSVQAALPSLALLAPGTHGALRGFLGGLNVFYLWATVLLALGMVRVARIGAAAAWIAAIVMLLATASMSALGAAQSG